MLSKGLEKVVRNILDVKQGKPELRYLYNDTKALVATDTRRMLILDTVLVNTECLLIVKKINNSYFSPDSFVANYPAITKGFNYPDYEKIIVNEKDRTVLNIDYGSDECNELICFIARLGLTFEVKFIQDLFVPKINLNVTKLIYDKDNIENPFMLEGTIEGYAFKYIIAPMSI